MSSQQSPPGSSIPAPFNFYPFPIYPSMVRSAFPAPEVEYDPTRPLSGFGFQSPGRAPPVPALDIDGQVAHPTARGQSQSSAASGLPDRVAHDLPPRPAVAFSRSPSSSSSSALPPSSSASFSSSFGSRAPIRIPTGPRSHRPQTVPALAQAASSAPSLPSTTPAPAPPEEDARVLQEIDLALNSLRSSGLSLDSVPGAQASGVAAQSLALSGSTAERGDVLMEASLSENEALESSKGSRARASKLKERALAGRLQASSTTATSSAADASFGSPTSATSEVGEISTKLGSARERIEERAKRERTEYARAQATEGSTIDSKHSSEVMGGGEEVAETHPAAAIGIGAHSSSSVVSTALPAVRTASHKRESSVSSSTVTSSTSASASGPASSSRNKSEFSSAPLDLDLDALLSAAGPFHAHQDPSALLESLADLQPALLTPPSPQRTSSKRPGDPLSSDEKRPRAADHAPPASDSAEPESQVQRELSDPSLPLTDTATSRPPGWRSRPCKEFLDSGRCADGADACPDRHAPVDDYGCRYHQGSIQTSGRLPACRNKPASTCPRSHRSEAPCLYWLSRDGCTAAPGTCTFPHRCYEFEVSGAPEDHGRTTSFASAAMPMDDERGRDRERARSNSPSRPDARSRKCFMSPAVLATTKALYNSYWPLVDTLMAMGGPEDWHVADDVRRKASKRDGNKSHANGGHRAWVDWLIGAKVKGVVEWAHGNLRLRRLFLDRFEEAKRLKSMEDEVKREQRWDEREKETQNRKPDRRWASTGTSDSQPNSTSLGQAPSSREVDAAFERVGEKPCLEDLLKNLPAPRTVSPAALVADLSALTPAQLLSAPSEPSRPSSISTAGPPSQALLPLDLPALPSAPSSSNLFAQLASLPVALPQASDPGPLTPAPSSTARPALPSSVEPSLLLHELSTLRAELDLLRSAPAPAPAPTPTFAVPSSGGGSAGGGDAETVALRKRVRALEDELEFAEGTVDVLRKRVGRLEKRLEEATSSGS